MSISVPASTCITIAHFIVDLPHFFRLRQQSFNRETVGNAETARVIGDDDVLMTALDAAFNHVANRILAIAPGCVHVQVGDDVCTGNQLRQANARAPLRFRRCLRAIPAARTASPSASYTFLFAVAEDLLG